MNCREAQRRLPGYLDGAISSRDHARLREHLAGCDGCRVQLEDYHRLSSQLSQLEAVAPPPGLAVGIRVQIAQAQPPWARARRMWFRALHVFEDILEPLAVPATGGILTALVVFVLLVQNILVGVPLGGVVENDLPLNIVQPARLESLAPFPVSDVVTADGHAGSGVLLVEATLNAQGQVVSYKVLSGRSDTAVDRQLDQVMMFSRFRPRFSFGRPTGGGHVMLSFSEVRVRG
ncbi:MAG: zf-HC2 domain-containing protein [Candidatus Acidiferrales bacterium]